jgi:nucleotide-binding universal stress UspA family protein
VLSVADLVFLPESEPVTPTPGRISTIMSEARAAAAAMMEAAELRAQSARERLQTIFPSWQIKAKSVADSPAWAIVLEAEAWNADLIVVGSHGHSVLDRWLLGSVSQTVLTQAPCSVRIGRGRPTTPGHPLRILVGVDGSEEAEMAVRTVAERTWPSGSDIQLVMVLEPSILAAMNSSSPTDEQDESSTDEEGESGIMEVLESHLAMVRQNSPDVFVSTRLMAGDPKRILIEEAERWGADCIFIGSRGLNRWERLLLGSVSAAVAARAHCPVEVVRSPRTLS